MLHSMMIASVCVRFGSPALYQHGSDAQLPSPGWKVLIVPAQAISTAPLPRRDGHTCEVRPSEVVHVHGRVVRAVTDGPVFKLCLRSALVDVGLRHEDGEGDVVDADVGPCNVLCEALPADP